MAFMHRLWARVGYTSRCRKATFRGVRLNRRKTGEFWQLNPIYNECQFSPFHLNSETLHAYIEQLSRYRPAFIHGYPSAISVLARQCKHAGVSLRPLGIKGVLLGSESVFPDQREEIEELTGARVLSWYGHSERIVLGGECEHSTAYHQFPDYGVLEIVDDKGNEVAVGETGEIVGTGLWNNAMPLIRYRTGDRARKLEPRCECGRSFPRFDQVEGRWKQEYVVGQSGSLISPAALNMHGSFFDQVVRYQYHQQQQGIVELRMMVTAKFTDIPSVQKKNAFITRQMPELKMGIDLTKTVNKQKFAKAIFGITQVMEGTQFYALFAMVLSLHRQNKMTGIGQMFQYTLRDESNHIALGRYILTQLIEENPDVWTPEFQRELQDLIDQAVELEIAFAEDTLPRGILGLNAGLFREYVQHIADRRIERIGLTARYGSKNPFPWMSETIDLGKEKNFFETRVTEYQTGGALNW